MLQIAVVEKGMERKGEQKQALELLLWLVKKARLGTK